MLSSLVDSALTHLSARRRAARVTRLPTRVVATSAGRVRVFDSGSTGPCVVFAPDGPNVIEHYESLLHMLSPKIRAVCFDMPGFGHSLPGISYDHSLDRGAAAVLEVLNALDIRTTTLAFSCANGFYAMRVAQLAPDRIERLVLSQTPSLGAMHAWTARAVPSVLRIRVLGQVAAWLLRGRAVDRWYRTALPKGTDPTPFQDLAGAALREGSCFCLASVVQSLLKEDDASLAGATTPCTMIWGGMDRSHRDTDPASLLTLVPHAELVHFPDYGHFPDLEQPKRYAALLMAGIERDAHRRASTLGRRGVRP
jgi:pimeloyl-ACP methyl ester carboxylesterase